MVETLLRYRADAASDAPALPLAEVLAADHGGNALAVTLVPGDDAHALLPLLDRLVRVDVHFPAYTDGRGYSSARILREHGFTGELRATGDVLLDQLSHMRRCGFDAFAPNAPIDRAAADRALATWPEVYQRTVDGRAPVWALRGA